MTRSFLLFCMVLTSFSAISGDPEADQYFPLNGDFAASHIIVAHKRAERAKEGVTRNKKEALARAKELNELVLKNPENFEEIARNESDGPSARVGGSLKAFNKGSMAPAFEDALKKLKPGEITKEPVKTQFGYHIIRRNSLEVKNYSARAFILTFENAATIRGIKDQNAYKRPKTLAEVDINEMKKTITTENFRKMVAAKGDLKANSGFMGVFKEGDGVLSDLIIKDIKELKYEELSNIVELPIGYAILQRLKVEKRAGSRIVVPWSGAKRAAAAITRSKEDAKALADELAAKLKANPSEFEALAKAHSGGPFAVRGGRLAPWFKGFQGEAFEDAYGQLTDGQITPEPVETEFGYQIIQRTTLD